MYEVLLSQGRPLPVLREGPDRVEVVVEKRIVKPAVIEFLAKADAAYQLRQRERIALGLLAQVDAMTARELADALELSEVADVANWLGRLPSWGVVLTFGRTKGVRYHVDPDLLRRMSFPSQTTLALIEPHRLDALVFEDLKRYPGSGITAVNDRIGAEIPRRLLKSSLDRLREGGNVRSEGKNKGMVYYTNE